MNPEKQNESPRVSDPAVGSSDLVRLRSDLQFCYDLLSHLLFIFENPKSVQAKFGSSETMDILADELPKIRAMHNLSDCYEREQPNDRSETPPTGGVRKPKSE